MKTFYKYTDGMLLMLILGLAFVNYYLTKKMKQSYHAVQDRYGSDIAENTLITVIGTGITLLAYIGVYLLANGWLVIRPLFGLGG